MIRNLGIPIFIDDYNHYMNGVDLANQYRSTYEVHRKGHRNWFPLLYFFLDAAITNAYRIQYIYTQQQGFRLPAQVCFRERLYQQLLDFACLSNDCLPPQRLDSALNHHFIQLGKRFSCVWCQHKRKKGQLELDRAPQSTFGCVACDRASLCKKRGCFQEFHSLPN